MNIDVTTRQGYDIATALRGPDFRFPTHPWLKTLFTARIRAWVGMADRPGRAICEVRTWARFDAKRIDQEVLADQPEQVYDALRHYLEHSKLACYAIAAQGGPYAQEAMETGFVANRLLDLIIFYQRQFSPKLYAPSQDWGAEKHYWELVHKALSDLNGLADQQEVDSGHIPF